MFNIETGIDSGPQLILTEISTISFIHFENCRKKKKGNEREDC